MGVGVCLCVAMCISIFTWQQQSDCLAKNWLAGHKYWKLTECVELGGWQNCGAI